METGFMYGPQEVRLRSSATCTNDKDETFIRRVRFDVKGSVSGYLSNMYTQVTDCQEQLL